MRTTAGAETTRQFPISFGSWYRILSSALGLAPAGSYVALVGDRVDVRMSWAFRATFPRSAIVSVLPSDVRPFSRGVHGFGGRWLVNGSSDGILSITLNPIQHAYVLGVRVRLRELLVSVAEPTELASVLAHPLPNSETRSPPRS